MKSQIGVHNIILLQNDIQLFDVVECIAHSIQVMKLEMNEETMTAAVAGNVEVCYNRVFNTLCGNSWRNVEASLVCKELGYSEFGKKMLIPH